MNWFKKLWNWLKTLFSPRSITTETVNLPSQPMLSDAEYETVLFALLSEVRKGKSWGSCQGILMSHNINRDKLAR